MNFPIGRLLIFSMIGLLVVSVFGACRTRTAPSWPQAAFLSMNVATEPYSDVYTRASPTCGIDSDGREILGVGIEYVVHECNHDPSVVSGGKRYLPGSTVAEATLGWSSATDQYHMEDYISPGSIGQCLTFRCRIEFRLSPALTAIEDTYLCTSTLYESNSCDQRTD